MKPTVVLTHRVFPETLELLRPYCELVTNQYDATLSRAEVLDRVRNADAMMAFMPDKVDQEFVDACPQLKVIGCALKGYDNFDVQACTQHKVWLTIVPDLLTVPTAELAIGLMINLVRNVPAAHEKIRREGYQGWRPTFYGQGIEGARIGILGMGSIGRAIAQRLNGWGAALTYSDQAPVDPALEQRLGLQWRSLDALIGECDILVLALALTHETFHLIDATRLAQLKKGAYLVNPCRGSVVNESHVLASLQSGHLGGYAADVFEMEDWARVDRPRQIDPALLSAANTLFTPHLGSAVRDVRRMIERCAAENILQALSGERPTHAVNMIRDGELVPC
ncbi:phosphonate dehydrogenase [Stutzerimonas kunmingensis]|uniref:phosphonate dehydrogenase n=1 Tax=Gammaproteobacteria TaxID=1236 RepID=UPI0028B065E8|nr:phosphonate dehydrogenase [Stutzerimonas kunmingensis]